MKLHPVGELIPEIGRTITMLCEITGQTPDIRPKWMKEEVAVLSLAGGKYHSQHLNLHKMH